MILLLNLIPNLLLLVSDGINSLKIPLERIILSEVKNDKVSLLFELRIFKATCSNKDVLTMELLGKCQTP